MDALEDRVYGCDICQDVCPWNRGVEKRRAGGVPRRRRDCRPSSLVDWLERDGQALVEELDRLFVPKNDPRWLRRNALVALGNVGRRGDERHAERVPRRRRRRSLRSVAARAAAKIAERPA